MYKAYAFFLVIVLVPVLLLGATFGSKSLLHVQSAATLKPGQLVFRSDMRFFTKVGDYLGANKPADFRTVNYWLVQGNALISYGIMDHLDATFMTRVYQDTHKPNEYNSPDDLFLDIKAGSFALGNGRFQLGGMLNFRFPTGQYHNYPFEPYTAGSLEFGILGMFSFFKDPFLPDRDLSIHLNLGWYDHNDAGKILYERKNPAGQVLKTYTAGTNATALQLGLGVIYPTELFDIRLEFWGVNYLSKPDSMAYSRENYLYLTPSIRFKPRWWFNFDIGMDIRVSPDKNETSRFLPDLTRGLTLPNYPAWRMTLGMGIVLSRGRGPGGGPVAGTEGAPAIRKKVSFIEKMMKEREKTRSIEQELKRLRREREQAEKELEELRQLLEEQKK